ncbi:lysoplasmalogenase [Roseateles amylovorans]|uniref:Lysoplasmalogenase n=1 Tax=Roseateles amylovorans TaxID=2978473 RepID=A0ABY6B5N4_9BURK|nr:lysoplasmalogenase [Roseateles amylovorans]UXH78843.1 lysoplasmalogenase [Roseateles amylovorans]
MTASVAKPQVALPLLTLISATVAILALSQPPQLPQGLGFVFKPLTTLLILFYALRRGSDQPRLARWLRAGLLCSLVGDIALLWPEQGFLPGLVSFLVAHVCYVVGFCTQVRAGAVRWPFLMFGVIAATVLGSLWAHVPAELRAPVVVYVLALSGMAAQAWAWWRRRVGQADEPRARWAAWGGTLFVLSDAMLAIHKFAGPMEMASFWVLASYWPAQWCIASSLRAPASMRMAA